MDQNQHGQPTREIGLPTPINLPIQIVSPSIASSYNIEQQQHAPQQMDQQHQYYLQQQLNNFWVKQRQEIEKITNFKTHGLPLAKIKKIMKTDEDVRMVSAEAPLVFAKACEMFILELSLKAWANAEASKRSIIKKSDIVSAISRTDVFDFLVDNFVPRDNIMVDHQVFGDISRNGPAQTQNIPHYYMPPHQDVAGLPYVPRMPTGSLVLDQNHHGLQIHTIPNQQHHLPNPDA